MILMVAGPAAAVKCWIARLQNMGERCCTPTRVLTFLFGQWNIQGTKVRENIGTTIHHLIIKMVKALCTMDRMPGRITAIWKATQWKMQSAGPSFGTKGQEQANGLVPVVSTSGGRKPTRITAVKKIIEEVVR